jgi:hypothetical protein
MSKHKILFSTLVSLGALALALFWRWHWWQPSLSPEGWHWPPS